VLAECPEAPQDQGGGLRLSRTDDAIDSLLKGAPTLLQTCFSSWLSPPTRVTRGKPEEGRTTALIRNSTRALSASRIHPAQAAPMAMAELYTS
jgi:hypothetical protein